MDYDEVEPRLRNLDQRVERIEQLLPTLATTNDLPAAIEPLATWAELQAAIEPLGTKAELQASIAGAERRMRTHFDVATESLHADIRLIAEGLAVLSQKVDQHYGELKHDIAGVDRRLMRIEAAQARS